jgi:protein-S-isoprenylcysteine O-methyltransferase Ste14
VDRWLLPVFGRLVVIASLLVSVWDIYLLGDTRFILPSVGVFGYLLLIAGLSLDIIGILTLRRSYSQTAQSRQGNQKLTTRGIYRFIRDPIYLGVILFCFSAPLIIRSLLGFLIMIAIIPMIIYRISVEEKALTKKFGNEYEEYARKTKRFIPYIY